MKSSLSSTSSSNKEKTDTIGRIEFVKEFKAHTGPVVDAVFSPDGRFLATISGEADESSLKIDKTVKVFDVVSFDMINFFELSAPPECICWESSGASPRLLIALKDSPNIYIHNPDSDTSPETPEYIISKLHKKPVKIIAYNAVLDCAISTDSLGMIEYWRPQPVNSASNNKAEAEFAKPSGGKWFDLKSSTNLYDCRKAKSIPTSLTISPNGMLFALFSFPDRKIRVFKFKSGKLLREYDESMQTLTDLRRLESVGKGGNLETENEKEDEEEVDIDTMEKMDDKLFESKVKRDERYFDGEFQSMKRYQNILFDESSRYIIFSSAIGIKIVNIRTNKVVRTLGAGEHDRRFLNLAIYQGFNRQSGSGKLTVEAAASDNQLIQKSFLPDPVLFATAFDSSRFYLFSRLREEDGAPAGDSSANVPAKMPQNIKQWIKASSRDIFNQKPTGGKENHQDSLEIAAKNLPRALRAKFAVLHTTLGDIRISFFPEAAPLAVENFVILCERGYYNNTIFHRIIKSFMLQGGDPDGDGTGGESMWTQETGNPYFKDEFDSALKHDKPFRLSMANAGPNTNGSQFFITTAATPWLDGKHTIFGQVDSLGGSVETVRTIEALDTNKDDRPSEPPQIVSTSIEY